MAVDFSWGYTFATLHPMSVDGDTIRFGTGVTGCVTSVPRPAAGDTVDRVVVERCGLTLEGVRAPAPASLAIDREAARKRGDSRMARALEWPETLPAYFAVVSDGDRLLLARPISADSLLFLPARLPLDPASTRFAAPLDSFVGCMDSACLWYDAQHQALALQRFTAGANRPRP